MILEAATLCLAMNVFFEARGESVPGQYAVALVTMNRANQDKAKVCEVVFKPKQFSWTNGVKATKTSYRLPSYLVKAQQAEPDAWKKAWRIAQVTLAGRMKDITHGSTYYHASYVQPYWTRVFAEVKTIGTHVFYRA
jgi:N-acetylmuramoyl-L-alanine amidase